MKTSPSAEDATMALRSAAASRGLAWFGVAGSGELVEERAHLERWLAEGLHGEMQWLARDIDRRTNPGLVVEDCRSVIVVGLNYLREDVRGTGEPGPFGLIARYARLRDYHRVIERELRALARVLSALRPGSKWRVMVDSGPAMERAWARRAGIGFIGKNTMLIHPRDGSFHMLGVLLTSAELEPTTPGEDVAGCGDCRRCLDACPTGAITEPWRLDARRCLSYLTIEAADPPAEEMWPEYAGWVFGCDICQEVCPYNRSRARPSDSNDPFGGPMFPGALPLTELLSMTDGFLAGLPVATPLRRAGADGLARNAAIVASERGGPVELVALRGLENDPNRPAWLRDLARRCADRLAGRL